MATRDVKIIALLGTFIIVIGYGLILPSNRFEGIWSRFLYLSLLFILGLCIHMYGKRFLVHVISGQETHLPSLQIPYFFDPKNHEYGNWVYFDSKGKIYLKNNIPKDIYYEIKGFVIQYNIWFEQNGFIDNDKYYRNLYENSTKQNQDYGSN